jgi:hypothetical protein
VGRKGKRAAREKERKGVKRGGPAVEKIRKGGRGVGCGVGLKGGREREGLVFSNKFSNLFKSNLLHLFYNFFINYFKDF